jgi:hypothetical protein
MLKKIVIIVVICIIFYLVSTTFVKHIENFDDFEDSVPVDLEMNKKYSKAFYYELDNTAYTAMLKKMFNVKSHLLMLSWKNVEDSDIIARLNASYQLAYSYILENVKTMNIQIILDEMSKYATLDGDLYIMSQMILYREAKTHGKHVKFVTKINDTIQVIYVEVMGIVSEDKFYLSPVQANDENNLLHTEVHT